MRAFSKARDVAAHPFKAVAESKKTLLKRKHARSTHAHHPSDPWRQEAQDDAAELQSATQNSDAGSLRLILQQLLQSCRDTLRIAAAFHP